MNTDNIKMSIISSLVLSIMDDLKLGSAWDNMTHDAKKDFLIKMNRHIADILKIAKIKGVFEDDN